jgi:nucleoside-diphosphate-sugar epimerase
MIKKIKKIMVTGAAGQIGSELTPILRERYGDDNILATDIVVKKDNAGFFESVDVTEKASIEEAVKKHRIDTIYHLAAVLSAKGEENPALAWNVNINGVYNILEVAREYKINRIFIPSSIAAFGPETPRDNTPQETILRPKTMYGLTKVAGELLGDYYVQSFNIDVRGCRFPGIISHKTLPGGGTTDYAVEIFFAAVKNKRYTCFLREDTVLPMMYMPDCLRAAVDLMEADFSHLKHHTDFNVSAMSFSAGELVEEIKKHIPEFVCEYKPDFRQKIADSWPKSIDDFSAREEWGWKPQYDLASMTKDMLQVLSKRQKGGTLNY